jgi:hypothetical protein
MPCLIQINTWNCALFGIISMLHLCYKKEITHDSFGQNNISKFQSSLFDLLTNKFVKNTWWLKQTKELYKK